MDDLLRRGAGGNPKGIGTYVGSHDSLNEHYPARYHNSDKWDNVKDPDDIEDDITWTTKLWSWIIGVGAEFEHFETEFEE